MARAYSAKYKSTLAAVSGNEPPLTLLEIRHPMLEEPVYVVNDTIEVLSNGITYIACPFRCELPEDFEGQLPKAKLSIDNVGRELMYWIEKSAGGAGTTVAFKQIMRSRPDTIEWAITMNLYNVEATMQEISAELGFENLFTRPAINIQYRPENSPGLF